MAVRDLVRKATNAVIVTHGVPLQRNGRGLAVATKSVPTLDGSRFWYDWPRTTGLFSTADKQEFQGFGAYAAVALAYVCIRYRAQKLVEAPPMVVMLTDDEEEWLPEHELAEFFDQPNRDYGFRRLYEYTNLYRDITGACLWVKVRDRGRRVRAVYPYSFDEFEIVEGESQLYGSFRVTVRGGKQIDVDPKDAVLFLNAHPGDMLNAVAPLEVALNMLNIGETFRVSARNWLKNALHPSGVVSIPEFAGSEQINEFRAELDNMFAGALRTGKPMILQGGATWTTIAEKLSDFMPAELISWVEATVCAVFGVHPMLLGIKTGLESGGGLARAGNEVASENFYRETIVPIWAADEEVLTAQLLRDVDANPTHIVRFDTTDIPALQEDRHEKAKAYEKYTPYMQVDEVRTTVLGLEPLGGEEGKKRYVPVQWVEADMLGGIEDEPFGDMPGEEEETPPDMEEE